MLSSGNEVANVNMNKTSAVVCTRRPSPYTHTKDTGAGWGKVCKRVMGEYNHHTLYI